MRTEAKRIAIYGGSFDPVHNGHLAIARELIDLFWLDQLWLMPAHVAPHKRGAGVTPALHRYAMLALATEGDERLLVSALELEAPERPYTIETVTRLGSDPATRAARLFFVMGADSWAEINSWREWERLLTIVDHIVVTRPGSPLTTDHVTQAVRERIVDARGASRADAPEATEGRHIYFTDAVLMNVSSTAVRRSVGAGRDDLVRAAVPPNVASYIRKYELYRNEREARE